MPACQWSIWTFQRKLNKNCPSPTKNIHVLSKKNVYDAQLDPPPHIWAGVGHTDLKITTNGFENFHRHFKDWFISPKPNIYTFLSNLQLIDIQFGIRANSVKTVAPDECAQYIKQAWEKVSEGQITKYEFIELCANLTQPIPPKSQRGIRKSRKVIKKLRKKLITESLRRKSRRLQSRRLRSRHWCVPCILCIPWLIFILYMVQWFMLIYISCI